MLVTCETRFAGETANQLNTLSAPLYLAKCFMQAFRTDFTLYTCTYAYCFETAFNYNFVLVLGSFFPSIRSPTSVHVLCMHAHKFWFLLSGVWNFIGPHASRAYLSSEAR